MGFTRWVASIRTTSGCAPSLSREGDSAVAAAPASSSEASVAISRATPSRYTRTSEATKTRTLRGSLTEDYRARSSSATLRLDADLTRSCVLKAEPTHAGAPLMVGPSFANSHELSTRSLSVVDATPATVRPSRSRHSRAGSRNDWLSSTIRQRIGIHSASQLRLGRAFTASGNPRVSSATRLQSDRSRSLCGGVRGRAAVWG